MLKGLGWVKKNTSFIGYRISISYLYFQNESAADYHLANDDDDDDEMAKK